jgi:hypothetical protein
VIHHVSGKIHPANAPSQQPDLLGEGPLIPAHSIARQMVSNNDTGDVEHPFPQKVHDLHFQRPKKELLDYFVKHYYKVDAEERAELVE